MRGSVAETVEFCTLDPPLSGAGKLIVKVWSLADTTWEDKEGVVIKVDDGWAVDDVVKTVETGTSVDVGWEVIDGVEVVELVLVDVEWEVIEGIEVDDDDWEVTSVIDEVELVLDACEDFDGVDDMELVPGWGIPGGVEELLGDAVVSGGIEDMCVEELLELSPAALQAGAPVTSVVHVSPVAKRCQTLLK